MGLMHQVVPHDRLEAARNQEMVTSNHKLTKVVVTQVTREEFDYLQDRVKALEAFLVVDPPPTKRERAAYMREYRKRAKSPT